jgi:hypothetical protein
VLVRFRCVTGTCTPLWVYLSPECCVSCTIDLDHYIELMTQCSVIIMTVSRRIFGCLLLHLFGDIVTTSSVVWFLVTKSPLFVVTKGQRFDTNPLCKITLTECFIVMSILMAWSLIAWAVCIYCPNSFPGGN